MKKPTKKSAIPKKVSAQEMIRNLKSQTSTLSGKKPALSTKLILTDLRAVREKNR